MRNGGRQIQPVPIGPESNFDRSKSALNEKKQKSLRPAALHDAALFAAAQARYLRRCQLWRNARCACPSYDTFRASVGEIEDAISAQLEREFA
jgi:hypothetical protein